MDPSLRSSLGHPPHTASAVAPAILKMQLLSGICLATRSDLPHVPGPKQKLRNFRGCMAVDMMTWLPINAITRFLNQQEQFQVHLSSFDSVTLSTGHALYMEMPHLCFVEDNTQQLRRPAANTGADRRAHGHCTVGLCRLEILQRSSQM